MNKKRWVLSGILTLLIGSLATLFFFLQPSVMGVTSGTLQTNAWTLHFSRSLNESTISEDSVYVLNKEKERVLVDVQLSTDGKILHVTPPENGYNNLQDYTLHLSDNIKSTFGLGIRGELAIPLKVSHDLATVESEEYLKNHFAAILENKKSQEQSYQSFDNVKMTIEESSSGGDSGHSQTNNQVDGVNEADIVQTDGEFIYHINDHQDVKVVKSYPAEALETVATIEFEDNFYVSQLFLTDDTLVVIGDKWIPFNQEKSGNMDYSYDQNVTIAKLYDVSNQTAPELMREVGAEGYFNNARMIDSNLYVITNHAPNYWIMEEDSDIELRPHTWDSNKSESFEPMSVDEIKIIPENENSNYTVITVVDVSDHNSEVLTESYLGSSGQVYMSENSLYLAETNNMVSTLQMGIMPVIPEDSSTTIYKFAIDDLNVDFVAKGSVKGNVLNQFSMDEHDDHFRVVTTEGNTQGENMTSFNHLFILNEAMEQVGSVEDLAKGERIYSARFMGDKAYMVTFRETDPLFVIDTANPEAPEVLGELKIPGFSTYLHPLDENHLIGFGVDTELEESKVAGQPPLVIQTGMKISLFDITDFSNPKEKDTEIIGGQGTHSPVMSDHKALFHHTERNLFGFPIAVYDQKELNSELNFVNQGALLYTITPENGIELTKEMYDQKVEGQMYDNWEELVQRMLYIEDTLYTVKSNEVKAYELP
ncbi:beta-propeller domain-containing protein [Jeotgalibacillus marinus]|uniref:Beta-propeller domain-containing protein n=1 Tax=Jeotgalibacillus marinus TaxID=86667 RepID=A0ABV3Q0V8_9BACL